MTIFSQLMMQEEWVKLKRNEMPASMIFIYLEKLKSIVIDVLQKSSFWTSGALLKLYTVKPLQMHIQVNHYKCTYKYATIQQFLMNL